MIKKLVVGGVVVALVAVLAVGAVNRTNARSGNQGNQSRGRSAQVESTGQGGRWSQSSALPADPASPGQNSARGGGRGNQNQNLPSTAEPGVGQAAITDWTTLNGVVQSLDKDMLVIELNDGQSLEIANRPWTYAQQVGFKAQSGDQVSLYGFYEDSTFETARISNLTSGQNLALRDDNGRPMWSGQGRRG